MITSLPEKCGARPSHGTARCDLPADHAGRHSAPLAIGGRLSFETDHRASWEHPTDGDAR